MMGHETNSTSAGSADLRMRSVRIRVGVGCSELRYPVPACIYVPAMAAPVASDDDIKHIGVDFSQVKRLHIN